MGSVRVAIVGVGNCASSLVQGVEYYRNADPESRVPGLMNVEVPEEYGGPGLHTLDGCLIEEEFGWGCSGIGTSLMCNGLASDPVIIGGSEEVKRRFLRPLWRLSPLSNPR